MEDIKKEIDKVNYSKNKTTIDKLNGMKKELLWLLEHKEIEQDKYDELYKFIEDKIYKILS